MSKQNEVKSTENKPNEKQEALKQSFENKIVIDIEDTNNNPVSVTTIFQKYPN
jgi:hypothetical protein